MGLLFINLWLECYASTVYSTVLSFSTRKYKTGYLETTEIMAIMAVKSDAPHPILRKHHFTLHLQKMKAKMHTISSRASLTSLHLFTAETHSIPLGLLTGTGLGELTSHKSHVL